MESKLYIIDKNSITHHVENDIEYYLAKIIRPIEIINGIRVRPERKRHTICIPKLPINFILYDYIEEYIKLVESNNDTLAIGVMGRMISITTEPFKVFENGEMLYKEHLSLFVNMQEMVDEAIQEFNFAKIELPNILTVNYVHIFVSIDSDKEVIHILGPLAILVLAILYASWAINEVNRQKDDEDNNYPSSPSSTSA